MDSERVTGLQAFLANDRAAVRVLASVESVEIRIVHSTEYVCTGVPRRGIGKTNAVTGRARRSRTHEPTPSRHRQ